MHEFMKNVLDWVLDKEEKSANNYNIPLKDIEKQINIVAEKNKYMKKSARIRCTNLIIFCYV